MRVRYGPAIPGIFIVLGLVNLVLGLWLLGLSGEANVTVFLGPLLALVGFLQLSRTYFSYDGRRGGGISVGALIGSMTRDFGGAKGGRLVVAGSKIVWEKPDGRTKRVPVNRLMARRADWDEVVARIERASRPAASGPDAADPSSEAHQGTLGER